MRLSPAALVPLLLLLVGCFGAQSNTGFYYQSECPFFGNGTSTCCHSVLMLNGAVYHPPAPAHRQRVLKPEGAPTTYDVPMLDAVDIKSAYAIPYAGVAAGITVGVVLWCNSLTVETDLGTYRAANKLPPCTTANGCFRKMNQHGTAAPIGCSCTAAETTAAQKEISLDVQMVSAVCPSCKILLVLANSPRHPDTDAAIQTAVAQGARVVSMSYGAPEEAVEPGVFATGAAAGVGFFAASGDNGFNQLAPSTDLQGNIVALNLGVQRPASFPHVIAVGGTVLNVAANARKWSEAAWINAGCGCSAFFPNPWSDVNTGCGAMRALTDVSAVAAQVRIVSGGLWIVVAGTSISTPIMASLFAITGNAGVPANWPYNVGRPHFLDITAGVVNVPNLAFPVPRNEFGVVPGTCGTALLCNGVVDYDGPTGVGVWYPVAPTCQTFVCPADYPIRADTTVCASLAGCTWDECCIPVCTATVAPAGYVGNCAAGLSCYGVACAEGYAGVPTATCVQPLAAPAPFVFAGCNPVAHRDKSNPAMLGLLALLSLPILFILALALGAMLEGPDGHAPDGKEDHNWPPETPNVVKTILKILKTILRILKIFKILRKLRTCPPAPCACPCACPCAVAYATPSTAGTIL